MAGSIQPLTPAVPQSRFQISVRCVPRILRLSLLDCLYCSLLVWLFVAGSHGWSGLLSDGDTGWHIRTGEQILDTGRVPYTDPYSFTRPDAEWFAWEWLADCIFAVSFRAAGLKGVTLVAGLVIPLAFVVMFRHMMWRGAQPLAALPLILLATGASAIHFLARPHIFTLLLLAVFLYVLDRDRRRHTRAVWALVPLVALWTNLHGGFLAAIASTCVVAIGYVLLKQWADARRYGLLALLSALASLLNPYGYRLHVHVAGYLRSDWIRSVVDEFQSPSFRSESMLHFEILLVAGIATAALLAARRRWIEALLILLWAHAALGAVRHVPVYAIVALPWIGEELTSWWSRLAGGSAATSLRGILDRLSQDLTPGFARASLWLALPAIVLAALDAPLKWPRDFPREKFPVAIVERHAELLRARRVLAPDQWGDYLIYRFYPAQKVFVDGRSDFYGKQIGDQYLALIQARHDWAALLAQHRFDAALVPPSWPLASLLKTDRNWRLVADDGAALLFVNAARDGAAARLTETNDLRQGIVEKFGPNLMKTTHAVEELAGDRRG